MRTESEITAELQAFESQFRQTAIPAGTPNRKALQLAENERCHQLACLPENIAKRLALLAELTKVRKSAKLKSSAALRKANPLLQLRSWIYRRLRKMGFVRETQTATGSAYYRCGSRRVRISDHEVPDTEQRQYNRANGGYSWANNRFSFEIQHDTTWIAAAKWLVAVRQSLQN